MLTPQEWEALEEALPEHVITKKHVEDARPDLEAALRPVLSRVWQQGHEDGYDQAFYDSRGTSADEDAHTFPRLNPYEET